jgi:hypothetical protein
MTLLRHDRDSRQELRERLDSIRKERSAQETPSSPPLLADRVVAAAPRWWDTEPVVWNRRRAGFGLMGLLIGATAAGAGVAVATSAFGGADSGVTGQVVCAVVLERDIGCSAAHARVVVRERSSNRRVATVKLGRMGHFRVALEPGDYVIELETPAKLSPWRPGQISVTVAPHRFTHTMVGMVPRQGPGLLRPLR